MANNNVRRCMEEHKQKNIKGLREKIKKIMFLKYRKRETNISSTRWGGEGFAPPKIAIAPSK